MPGPGASETACQLQYRNGRTAEHRQNRISCGGPMSVKEHFTGRRCQGTVRRIFPGTDNLSLAIAAWCGRCFPVGNKHDGPSVVRLCQRNPEITDFRRFEDTIGGDVIDGGRITVGTRRLLKEGGLVNTNTAVLWRSGKDMGESERMIAGMTTGGHDRGGMVVLLGVAVLATHVNFTDWL